MHPRLLSALRALLETIRDINSERAAKGAGPLCERCAKPVRANLPSYELFERMHYSCFHLEHEHGDTDPDDDCGVPGCVWGRRDGSRHDDGGREDH